MCRKYQSKLLLQQDTNCHGNQQSLFNTITSLLGKDDKPRVHVTLSTEDVSVAEKFNDYSVSKIVTISDALSQLSTSTPALTCPPVNSSMKCADRKLNTFKPASFDEISKIVMKVSKSTCSLDTVPTRFLRYVLPAILRMLVHSFNLSLSSGFSPHF